MIKILIKLLLMSMMILSISIHSTIAGEKQIQLDLLHYAYFQNSRDLLDNFFQQWQRELPPIKIENIQDDTLKAIYEVFNTFYQPNNLAKFGSEWGNGYYPNRDYYIIQNSLHYCVVDTIVFTRRLQGPLIKEDVISDFRPEYNYKKTKGIYLSEHYRSILLEFLGESYSHSANRRNGFLNSATKIVEGHNSGWIILTHPYCSRMTIDKNFTKAVIWCNIIYQFGWVQLEKKNNIWIIVDAKLPIIM